MKRIKSLSSDKLDPLFMLTKHKSEHKITPASTSAYNLKDGRLSIIRNLQEVHRILDEEGTSRERRTMRLERVFDKDLALFSLCLKGMPTAFDRERSHILHLASNLHQKAFSFATVAVVCVRRGNLQSLRTETTQSTFPPWGNAT